MRYLITLISMTLLGYISQAQTYEVGPFLGGANFVGDVGNTNYISPNTLVGGAIFKWNRSARHAFRFSILHTKLKADDADSDEQRRQQRGLSFTNGLTEASLGLEYTFWEWNLHNYKPQLTPYLYTGLTAAFTNHMYIKNNKLTTHSNNTTIAIPMVIGIKGTLNTKWVLALEIGARYTFTDNIDGSNPKEINAKETFPPFGNPNTNDWYIFTGISLTYSFGRKPCYCIF
ncbi:MAG: DUF6089 family protein [Mesonia hippocampi]|uniref:type IX secretion system protein PorG n=1 Tax=Mesonia hippocampi TaxID=1628250 RepID=UPI003F95E778